MPISLPALKTARISRCLLALIMALCSHPAMAWTETPSNVTDSELTESEQDIEEATQPFGPDPEFPAEPETEEPTPPGVDECDWDLEDQHWQEQSQEVLRSLSCHSFRWFDSWWGDSKDYPEDAVNGLVTAGGSYRNYDGFDSRFRFKVRAPLPNLDRRWDVMLGRVDEDAYVSDTQAQDQTFYNPGVVNRGVEDSWLLGLGHRRKSLRKGWDWSIGLRLRAPPEPYAKLSYYYNTQTSENSDLRVRQTFFWRSDEGFGTTTRGDFAWSVRPRNVLRWEGVGTVSEDTEGARWYVGQTWYHLMSGRKAFSLLTWARGETDGPVGLTDGGFNFVWRQPFTRDYMYISYGPSLTWPREFPEDKREMNIGFGVWLEMEFGNWRY